MTKTTSKQTAPPRLADVSKIASLLPGFALPQGELSDELAKTVAIQDGCQVVSKALSQTTETLGVSCPGLEAVLRTWLETPDMGLWHPAVGRIPANPRDKPYLMTRLVEIGVLANLAGIGGNWSFHFKHPAPLWLGRYLLQPVIRGRVFATAQNVVIEAEEAAGQVGRLHLQKEDETSRWQTIESPSNADFLPGADVGGDTIALIPGPTLGGLKPPFPHAQFLEMSGFSTVLENLEKTADLFQHHAPRFQKWVTGVVKWVAPTDAPGDMQGSSSNFNHPGLITMSNDMRAAGMGEMLVHEASHQRFHIAQRLGSVDDGTDRRRYFSSLARRERPIDRILLAFHALGNIVLYYRDCLASGIVDGGYCEGLLPDRLERMRQLHEILFKTNALTPIGSALWRPLIEAVEAA